MLARRIATAAVIAAAGLSLAAGSALAKGGGNGGGGGGGGESTPTPTPTPAVSLCPEFADGGTFLPDGSSVFADDFPGQMCAIVSYSLTNVLSLRDIRLAPGWTATTKSSGGGSSNKIDIEWRNPSTGESHELVQQPGKSVVK
jgi:hypothetical protein